MTGGARRRRVRAAQGKARAMGVFRSLPARGERAVVEVSVACTARAFSEREKDHVGGRRGRWRYLQPERRGDAAHCLTRDLRVTADARSPGVGAIEGKPRARVVLDREASRGEALGGVAAVARRRPAVRSKRGAMDVDMTVIAGGEAHGLQSRPGTVAFATLHAGAGPSRGIALANDRRRR